MPRVTSPPCPPYQPTHTNRLDLPTPTPGMSEAACLDGGLWDLFHFEAPKETAQMLYAQVGCRLRCIHSNWPVACCVRVPEPHERQLKEERQAVNAVPSFFKLQAAIREQKPFALAVVAGAASQPLRMAVDRASCRRVGSWICQPLLLTHMWPRGI